MTRSRLPPGTLDRLQRQHAEQSSTAAQTGSTPKRSVDSTSPQGERHPPGGISRKAKLLVTGLIAAARANPEITAAVVVGTVSGGVALRQVRWPLGEPMQPNLKNSEPDQANLVVFDRSHEHGSDVAFVARSSAGEKAKIDLTVPSGPEDMGCDLYNSLAELSKIKNPPKVIVMSLCLSPAGYVGSALSNEVNPGFFSQYGEDSSAWPDVALDEYRKILGASRHHYIRFFKSYLNEKCDGNVLLRKKIEDTYNILVDSGITVVVSAGNNGELQNQLESFGLDVPEDLFMSNYLNDDVLPRGVIVVGGSQTFGEKQSAAIFSNPNPAVDVLANSVDINIDAEGSVDSGTSFAAPIVGALVLKILEINPELSPAEIENIIVSTATPLHNEKEKAKGGVIDEKKAIEMAKLTVSNLAH